MNTEEEIYVIYCKKCKWHSYVTNKQCIMCDKEGKCIAHIFYDKKIDGRYPEIGKE